MRHGAVLKECATMQQNVVSRDPDVLGGTPVFTNTRVPVQTLLDYLEDGQSLQAFLDDFPSVSREQAVAALEHLKDLLLQSPA
jgi:uncharacterized protein (DUF433 family)